MVEFKLVQGVDVTTIRKDTLAEGVLECMAMLGAHRDIYNIKDTKEETV